MAGGNESALAALDSFLAAGVVGSTAVLSDSGVFVSASIEPVWAKVSDLNSEPKKPSAKPRTNVKGARRKVATRPNRIAVFNAKATQHTRTSTENRLRWLSYGTIHGSLPANSIPNSARTLALRICLSKASSPRPLLTSTNKRSLLVILGECFFELLLSESQLLVSGLIDDEFVA